MWDIYPELLAYRFSSLSLWHLSFPFWPGTSHHCIEDLSLICSLPGFTVIVPADTIETARVVAKRQPVPMEFVAIKDTYAKSGKLAELLQRYGLTAKDIEQAVHKVTKGKKG